MPTLTLINGAPGSGKSTLAHLLARERAFTLLLDIDTVRGSLAHWNEDPMAAGMAARRLALSMSATHLSGGYDVVVPQFLQREEFVDQLALTAKDASAQFLEVCLVSSPEEAASRFATRVSSDDPNHVAARLLQSMPTSESVEVQYHRMYSMVSKRPSTAFVESIPGEVDQTYARLREALHTRA